MTTIAQLESLAHHARMSHRHWVLTARQGGSGAYGAAYCLEGAATWRRRTAEILAQLRAKKDAAARAAMTRRINAAERGARTRMIQEAALARAA